MQTVSINDHNIKIKEFKGQRVVTFHEIDEVHGRPNGTAGRAFRENRKYFKDGIDFFAVTPPEFQLDEIRRFGISSPRGGYIITESGYFMLCKSFGDQLAWDVHRQLVNSYFKAQEQKQPVPLTRAPLTRIFRNRQVMTLLDIYDRYGVSKAKAWYCFQDADQFKRGKDYAVLRKFELADFKAQNPDIPPRINSLTIVSTSGVEKLCRCVGVKCKLDKLPALPEAIDDNTPIPYQVTQTVKTMARNCCDIPVNPEIQSAIKAVRKSISALECSLDMYSRYRDPDKATQYQDLLSDIGCEVAAKTYTLSQIPFGIVEKHI